MAAPERYALTFRDRTTNDLAILSTNDPDRALAWLGEVMGHEAPPRPTTPPSTAPAPRPAPAPAGPLPARLLAAVEAGVVGRPALLAMFAADRSTARTLRKLVAAGALDRDGDGYRLPAPAAASPLPRPGTLGAALLLHVHEGARRSEVVTKAGLLRRFRSVPASSVRGRLSELLGAGLVAQDGDTYKPGPARLTPPAAPVKSTAKPNRARKP